MPAAACKRVCVRRSGCAIARMMQALMHGLAVLFFKRCVAGVPLFVMLRRDFRLLLSFADAFAAAAGAAKMPDFISLMLSPFFARLIILRALFRFDASILL